MGWLNKKTDPVSARARALDSQITALEQQINHLNSQIGKPSTAPRLRSTALPHGATISRHPTSAPLATVPEPIFEDVNQDRLKAKAENIAPPEQFNELGVRKYDLAGLITRVKGQFRGPPTSNPRLVNYLAAGGVQGLRPMRYEKRVARNRLLVLVIGLLALLLGILSVFIKNH
jgi:hypothetical protein